MRCSFCFAAAVLSFTLLAGCSDSKSSPTAEKVHDLKGIVVSVDSTKKTVKIDHQEMPGFMKAMTMSFSVEDAKLLEGLVPGDAVEGKVKKVGSDYVLAELRKTGRAPIAKVDVTPNPDTDAIAKAKAKAEADAEEAEVILNFAKLSPEDRKLAEAQRECPTGGRLGGEGMGVPIKLMIKGEPVFICCKGCKGAVEKDPDETLKKVADLRKGIGIKK